MVRKARLTPQQKNMLKILHEDIGNKSFTYNDYYNTIHRRSLKFYFHRLKNKRPDYTFQNLVRKGAVRKAGERGEEIYSVNTRYIIPKHKIKSIKRAKHNKPKPDNLVGKTLDDFCD